MHFGMARIQVLLDPDNRVAFFHPRKDFDASPVGDLGINEGALNATVAQMVTDYLKLKPALEQVRGNRVPQAVDGIASKIGTVGITFEKLLNPVAAQIALSAGKQRVSCGLTYCQIGFEHFCGVGQQGFYPTYATFDPMNVNALAGEIDIRKSQPRRLCDSKSVAIDDTEQRPIPSRRNTRKKPFQFGLCEVFDGHCFSEISTFTKPEISR